MRHPRATLAVAAALALTVTACGGGGTGEDPTTTDDGPSVTDTGGSPTATTAPATTAPPTTTAPATTAPATTGTTTPAATGAGPTGEVATDVGVTSEACPAAVNPDNGCIYLGIISDLTEGPFVTLAVPITEAQVAFWNRVNEGGGIGGAYDVDVETYTRDNKYNPEIHNQVYQEIKPNILALAQTLGSPTTAAIIDDMVANDIIGAPASWTSLWDTAQPGTNILESGASYCAESMNAVDYFAEQNGGVESVLALHVQGDYGDDGAAGAKIAAEAHGAEFSHVAFSGADSGSALQGAIGAVVQNNPDVVIMTTTPSQAAEIVGGAAAQGYQGRFIGTSPSWNPALLQTAAGEALQGLYWQSAPWATYASDTPGHQAMREALGDVVGNDGYTAGWAWSYPLLAALQQAYASGDLTRAGLLAAIESLESVDYEGMLPPEAGVFAGPPNDQFFRQSVIHQPDPESPSGVSVLEEFYAGETAANYAFEGACYETVDLG